MAEDTDPTDDGTEATDTGGDRLAALAQPLSTFKVRGQLDAPGGVGVQGYNTADTGTAIGVEGVTSSLTNGAAGVYGSTTNAGTVAKQYGVLGEASAPGAVFENPAGVLGRASATGDQGPTYGVQGKTFSTSVGAAGVFAEDNGGMDRSYGVKGRTLSTGGAGVEGEVATNFDVDGPTAGVRGVNRASRGLSTIQPPSGVEGVFANSGIGYGVRGAVGDISNNDAAGVRAVASGAATAIRATAAGGTGIQVGNADDFNPAINVQNEGGGAAVRAEDADATTGGSIAISGATNSDGTVAGETASAIRGFGSGTDTTFGVSGTDSSPNGAGVLGETEGDNAAGVVGDATAASGAAAVEARGRVDVSKVGLSAYLGSDQTIPDISFTTVAFDSVVRDDFSGFDTSTGRYTVPADGDYQVSVAVEWGQLPEGSRHRVRIAYDSVSGVPDLAADVRRQTPPSGGGADVHDTVSKTVYGLRDGEDVYVEVLQNSGSSTDILAGRQGTYLTIDKVG